MTTTFYDYWRSSASYRVRIALAHLGIEHDVVPVDLLAGEQRSEGHLRRNPQGLVPTLAIDGEMLSQSLAIIEYLDETRAGGLLPEDAAGRARVRTLSYAIAMEIHPVCNLSVARYASERSGGAITLESWNLELIGKGLLALERLLDDPATGTYCHGDAVTLADLCLVPQAYNGRRWGVDFAPLPRIRRIVDALDRLEAFRSAHPDRHRPVD